MSDPRDNDRSSDAPASDEEDLYSPEYLRDVAADDARQQRLEELKRRIELGAYKPDIESIAEGMLSRVAEEGLELDES